jgi:hypothetical protein
VVGEVADAIADVDEHALLAVREIQRTGRSGFLRVPPRRPHPVLRRVYAMQRSDARSCGSCFMSATSRLRHPVPLGSSRGWAALARSV